MTRMKFVNLRTGQKRMVKIRQGKWEGSLRSRSRLIRDMKHWGYVRAGIRHGSKAAIHAYRKPTEAK